MSENRLCHCATSIAAADAADAADATDAKYFDRLHFRDNGRPIKTLRKPNQTPDIKESLRNCQNFNVKNGRKGSSLNQKSSMDKFWSKLVKNRQILVENGQI